MSEQDHYEILGVANNATQEEIRRSYKHLCQKYHPDRNPDNSDHFMLIRKAYDVLSNLQRKVIYDQGIRQGINPQEFKVALDAIVNRLMPKILGRLTAHGGSFEQSAQFELTTAKSLAKGERKNLLQAQEIVNKYLDRITSGMDSYFAQGLMKKSTEINVAITRFEVEIAVLKFLSEDTKNIISQDETEMFYVTFATGASTTGSSTS